MVWGLRTKEGKRLAPLTFSDGKNQEDCIDEILDLFGSNDLVFLHGAVGSGKSIIAATIAGYLGRGIINVPVKPLQDQYSADFANRFDIILGELPLDIQVLKGRHNFPCRRVRGARCSDSNLPCTVRLKKRDEDGRKVSVPRWEVAKECAYWSPIYDFQFSGEIRRKLEPMTVAEYENAMRKTMYFIQRKEGCGYYDQNRHYVHADVLVYNNAKWKADTLIGRKPSSDIEIFDEADTFFDGLILKTTISEKMLGFIEELCNEEKNDNPGVVEHINEFLNLVRGGYVEIIRKSIPDSPNDVSDEHVQFLNNLNELLEYLENEKLFDIATQIHLLLEYREMLVFYSGAKGITFFVPRPDIVLKDYLCRSSKRILFMSATVQSLELLSQIYGIDELAYAVGEPLMPGKIKLKKTGFERHINYARWQNKEFRDGYFKLCSKILQKAARPTLVQVHSFKYLPEDKRYPYLPSRDGLKKVNQDEEIGLFKTGESEILFSTKTDRGIDLPDEKCRSIVLQKYPYPSVKDPILITMRKKFGEEAFWIYYNDIAERELLQQIGRGVRHPDDWVEVWSPDKKVHSTVERKIIKWYRR